MTLTKFIFINYVFTRSLITSASTLECCSDFVYCRSKHKKFVFEFPLLLLSQFRTVYGSQYSGAGDSKPSLPNTWVVYEELFDSLDDVKEALNRLTVVPDWLGEVQSASRRCGQSSEYTIKLRNHLPMSMLLPPSRSQEEIHEEGGYGTDLIEEYVETEARFQRHYDTSWRIVPPRRPLQRGKRRRPSSSDSDSSDGMEYSELTSYMGLKRDPSVTDALSWWKGYQAMYPNCRKSLEIS